MKKTNAIRILERHKIAYDTVAYQYDPANLALDKIAADNDLELKAVYKTLVAKGDKTGVVIAVVPGDQELNFKALAKASGNKKITLVAVKELQGLTGYIRGGCSPLGMKKEYPVFIEAVAEQLEQMYVNAGVRGVLVGLSPNELGRATKGVFAEIC